MAYMTLSEYLHFLCNFLKVLILSKAQILDLVEMVALTNNS